MADTVYQQLRAHLAYLRLAAAAEQLARRARARPSSDKPGYTQFLARPARRRGRRHRATPPRKAGCGSPSCPRAKTLEQFDFGAQPGLDRRLVDELATLRFIEEQGQRAC